MPVIKLTHNDLNEMIRRAVHSILSESVKEAMGSAMAEKDDVIQELVDYIEAEWEKIKETGKEPDDTGRFSAKDGSGSGRSSTYIILAPDDITEKLGIAKKFDLNIAIRDYQVSQKLLGLFGPHERASEGTTYYGKNRSTGEFYGKFSKPTMKIEHGRVDLEVPAINGELQTKGLYSVLYHELNHSFTTLSIKQKKSEKTDGNGNPIDSHGNPVDVDVLNTITMSRRAKEHPHFSVQNALHQDEIMDFMTSLQYGSDKEYYNILNFLFYAVWETTERNARAEEMYGNLQALNAKRSDFKAIYPQTSLYNNLEQYNEMLNTLDKVSAGSPIWEYAAQVMNMKESNSRKGTNPNYFFYLVKKRFIKHTKELLDKLYRKGMKVAEYYFQRQEEKQRKMDDTPGGGIEKLGRIISSD